MPQERRGRALFQLLTFPLPGSNLIAQVAFRHKSSQGSAHGAGSSDSSQTERVLPAGMVLRALLHKNHAALQWLSQQSPSQHQVPGKTPAICIILQQGNSQGFPSDHPQLFLNQVQAQSSPRCPPPKKNLAESSPERQSPHLSASSTCCKLKSSEGTILSMCCGSQMLAWSSSFTVFLTTPCRPLMPDIRILGDKATLKGYLSISVDKTSRL